MEILAEQIVAIVKDYHNYLDFQFTPDYVLQWVKQFEGNDQEFLLQELLHLLQQGIYINEQQGRELLINRIEALTKQYKYKTAVEFLVNADILSLQDEEKSQTILLQLLDEELNKKYGIGLTQCGTVSKKYALYIDDVLATGGTVFKDCLAWLQTNNDDGISNLNKVIDGEKILTVSVFCLHNWANVKWRLRVALKNEAILKKINLYYDYEIQNHPAFLNQSLNFAYPVAEQPQTVLDYFNSLIADKNEALAFRKPDEPKKELLFSTAANRIRFENIMLHKGVELLQQAQNLKPNHRPLGATFPSYKTMGTGTLFFTWRNISNTCPIVFWWKVEWHPLFRLHKRGLAI